MASKKMTRAATRTTLDRVPTKSQLGVADPPAPSLPLQDKLQRPRISNLSQRPFSDELWAQPAHNFGAFAPERVVAPPGFANVVWALAKQVIRFNVRGDDQLNAFAAHFFTRLVASRSGISMATARRRMREEEEHLRGGGGGGEGRAEEVDVVEAAAESVVKEGSVADTTDGASVITTATTETTETTTTMLEIREAGDGQEEQPVFSEVDGVVAAKEEEEDLKAIKGDDESGIASLVAVGGGGGGGDGSSFGGGVGGDGASSSGGVVGDGGSSSGGVGGDEDDSGAGWCENASDVSVAFSGPELEAFWLAASEAGDFAAKRLNYKKHF